MSTMSKPLGKPLLVQKFGGTSLADLKGFDASAKVIAQYVDDYRVIVVLSAVKGVTDLLLAAIDTSVAGEDGGEHLEEAIRRERAIVSDLASGGFATPQATSYLDEQEAVLSRMVEGIRLLGQCPDETRARILATGEGFASRLMVDVLQARGYDALWSDTDVLPPANDDWLDSLVDVEAAAPLVKARLEERDSQVVVLPGFYGRNAAGKIQLMGRNGTDYTAACMAAASGAGLCQIWKDVDGFFTADVEKMHVFKDWNQIDRAVGFNLGSPAHRRGQHHVAGSHIDIGFVTDRFNHLNRGRYGLARAVFSGPLEIFRSDAHNHFLFSVIPKIHRLIRRQLEGEVTGLQGNPISGTA